MAVYNREIIKHITDDENYKRLEDIIAKETKEFYALPWKARWLDFEKKVKTQEYAEAVLAKAKEDTDLFLGAGYAADIPSLELKRRMTIKDYHLNSNINLFSLSLIAAGLFILYNDAKTGNGDTSVAGTIPAAAGMAGGIVHFARKVKQNSPAYIPEEQKIICVTGKESEVYCDMAHEYSHAVFMRSISDRKECMFANEGFAEGVSTCLSKKENIKTGLFNSVYLLVTARNQVQKKCLKNPYEPVVEKLHTGEEIDYWGEMIMRSTGYAAFRLAEEKYGANVYREFIRGNTGILLE
ncbi:MAG: hypothetical protein V1734_06195 [Nanoarchaeota archaeon]